MIHDEITTVVILSRDRITTVVNLTRYTGAARYKTVCGLSINASDDDHE